MTYFSAQCLLNLLLKPPVPQWDTMRSYKNENRLGQNLDEAIHTVNRTMHMTGHPSVMSFGKLVPVKTGSAQRLSGIHGVSIIYWMPDNVCDVSGMTLASFWGSSDYAPIDRCGDCFRAA